MADRNIELTRRKILASAGAVGAAGVGAGLGTSALFSDEETFVNNQLVAGELDMKVSWDVHYFRDDAGSDLGYFLGEDEDPPEEGAGYPTSSEDPMFAVEDGNVTDFMSATRTGRHPPGGLNEGEDPCTELADVPDDLEAPIIDLDDVKPGDFGEVTFDFSLCDNPGYVWMTGSLSEEGENGVNEPEGAADGEDATPASGSLWPLAALAAVPALGGDGDSGDGNGGVVGDETPAETEADGADDSSRRSALRKGAAAAGAGAAGLSVLSGSASASSPNPVNISNTGNISPGLEVNVGELASGDAVVNQDWTFAGQETLYRETYGFRDGTGPHSNAELDGSIDTHFPNSVSPGNTAQATVTIPVQTDGGDTVDLEVDRNVTLDPAEPTLRVEYQVTNPSGSGATFTDLRLSQYIDYDIGDVSDDAGEYFIDQDRGCEFIAQSSDPNDPVFSGFTGEEFSVNHDLREYGLSESDGQGNFESGDPSFNNADAYPNSGTDDVTLAFEWSLGTLAPGETTTFRNSFVYNESRSEFEDELCAESDTDTPTPTPTPSPGGPELADAAQARVWYDDFDNIHEDDEQIFLEGSLREVLDALSSGAGVPLDGDESTATDFDETEDPPTADSRDCYEAANDVHYVGFEWWVPPEVGNEIQSDSVKFDLGFYTEQCRNNDGGSGNA